MSFTIWVRAQDAHGRFDVRKGDELRDGVTLVDDYPEHIGVTGRPGKPFVDLRIETESYGSMRVAELTDLIEQRNATAVDAHELIEIPADVTKKKLIALLEADDKTRAELVALADQAPASAGQADDHTSSDPDGSGTAEGPNTTNAGQPGGESE